MPDIREENDKFLESWVKEERHLSMDKTFEMKKCDVVKLPPNMHKFMIGLGWSFKGPFHHVDPSCVCLDKNKDLVGFCNFSTKIDGIVNRGDLTTAEYEKL